jgi:membrane protein DedA with SNARE-associated domain
MKVWMRTLREFLEPGMFQYMMVLVMVIMGLVWVPLGLPDPDETVAIGEKLFTLYGPIILFVGAFIEGLFMVNLYFPGSFVILLAILISNRTLPELTFIAFIAWLAFTLAAAINYVLGKYGLYRALLFLGSRKVVDNMTAWMNRRGRLAVFLTAVHPNFHAIAMVSMGVARTGFIRSINISMLSMAIWAPILTALTAWLLPAANETDSYYWYLVTLFFVWGLFLSVRRTYFPKKTELPDISIT